MRSPNILTAAFTDANGAELSISAFCSAIAAVALLAGFAGSALGLHTPDRPFTLLTTKKEIQHLTTMTFFLAICTIRCFWQFAAKPQELNIIPQKPLVVDFPMEISSFRV
jgi:hypothetical protein